MNKSLFASLLSLIGFLSSYGQDTLAVNVRVDTVPAFTTAPAVKTKTQVYKIKPAVDVPITVVGTAWSLYAFTKIYSKDGSTVEQIQALNKNNISKFNRWGADVYSKKAQDASNVFFYGSMPLPLLYLLDKHIRKDAGKIGFLYLEAMSITGLLYTSSVYFVDKYRPYAYNNSAPMSDRTGGGAKNSFFAGHVALVGTSTFFMAKVFANYHPYSKLKWVGYALAIGATGATAYLRHRGGEHFPSDILIGIGVGTLSGLLVPHFHQTRLIKNERVSITPFAGQSSGLALTYKL